ncbi:MAG: hypothetical protein EOO41_01760 [Methanobacteriota archaeon]|nr:MAG: hypothetical protein EOO41_01760 [Euryarchaeota archaeon]
MNPIKKYGYSGPGLDALVLLRRQVLDGLLLRRTKASRAADLSLPGRLITVRNDVELDMFEVRHAVSAACVRTRRWPCVRRVVMVVARVNTRVQNDFYEALYTRSKSKFDAYVNSSTLLNNYAHIFDLLTRLRQAVDHPYLILYGNNEEAARAGAAVGETDSEAAVGAVCGICREAVEDAVATGCRHYFCRLCMQEYLGSLGGSALSLMHDRTNDPSAAMIVDDAAADALLAAPLPDAAACDDAPTAAAAPKAKRPRKSAAVAAAAGLASPAGAAAMSGGGAPPTCPTCFAPLTVDLASVDATTAGPTAAGVSVGMWQPQRLVGECLSLRAHPCCTPLQANLPPCCLRAAHRLQLQRASPFWRACPAAAWVVHSAPPPRLRRCWRTCGARSKMSLAARPSCSPSL